MGIKSLNLRIDKIVQGLSHSLNLYGDICLITNKPIVVSSQNQEKSLGNKISNCPYQGMKQ